jgi:hypothetical protein
MEHEVELLLEWHLTKWSMALIHETSEAFESQHIKENIFCPFHFYAVSVYLPTQITSMLEPATGTLWSLFHYNQRVQGLIHTKAGSTLAPTICTTE